MWGGGKDDKVSITAINHYALKLHRQNKAITLIVDNKQGHIPEDEIAREAYLTAIDRYIASHIGVALKHDIPEPVSRYLDSKTIIGSMEF